MPKNAEWPLAVEDIFLSNINLGRQPSMPDNIEIQLLAETKINLRNKNKFLQVNVKLKSADDMHIKMMITAIGLFRYLDNKADENQELIADYVNRFAIPIVWSFIKTNIKTITSSMGIPPINIPMPNLFLMPKESIFSEEQLEDNEEVRKNEGINP